MTEDIQVIETGTHIKLMELSGNINPECKMCLEIFYPLLYKGKRFWDIFAPRHKASSHCRSGKNPHCTCDTCF